MGTASNLLDDILTSDKIADSAVTAADWADEAVLGRHVVDFAFSTSDIGDNAIADVDLLNGTFLINSDMLADGSVLEENIVNNAITSGNINFEVVNSNALSPKSVYERHLGADIQLESFAAQTINLTTFIIEDTITSDDFSDFSITSDSLAP